MQRGAVEMQRGAVEMQRCREEMSRRRCVERRCRDVERWTKAGKSDSMPCLRIRPQTRSKAQRTSATTIQRRSAEFVFEDVMA
jgi:hypothetical protein